jgi:hypothetical protein
MNGGLGLSPLTRLSYVRADATACESVSATGAWVVGNINTLEL